MSEYGGGGDQFSLSYYGVSSCFACDMYPCNRKKTSEIFNLKVLLQGLYRYTWSMSCNIFNTSC